MRRRNKFAMLLVLLCMTLGALHVSAADELLGTVVDGSLLTEETEVSTIVYPLARWSYLSNGTGTLTVTGSKSFRMTGSTSASQSVDKIYVNMYLQRLVNGTWSNYITAPRATAYNTYFVSSTNNYTVEGGYYYRARGGHVVTKGSTTESASSYTDGIWVD